MNLSRPLRLALTLWIAVGVAVSIRTLLKPADHTSFPVFAASADHWRHDQPLYADYTPLDFFRYPPSFAVLFAPLAGCGLRLGGILWSWLSLIVYGAGLWAFARHVLPVNWTDKRLACYLALGLLGGLRGLWNSQSNALLVGLLLLGTVALVHRRWWMSALLLAAATVLKLTPLAPVLLLCGLRTRHLIVRLAIAVILLAAVPFLTRPPANVVSQYEGWARHLTESAHQRWPGFRDAWTVWQVMRQCALGDMELPPLKEPLDSPLYRAVQMASALGLLGWTLWLRRRGTPERELVTVSLAAGLGWLMLFGPAVEHSTYVFLAPVLCWGFLECDKTARRALIVSAFVLVMVLGWGSLTRPLLDVVPAVLVSLPLGTALFLAWLLLRPLSTWTLLDSALEGWPGLRYSEAHTYQVKACCSIRPEGPVL